MKICSFLIKNNDFLLKMGFFFPILCKKFISIQNILYNFQQFVWLFPIKELFWKWDNRWSLRPNFSLGATENFPSGKFCKISWFCRKTSFCLSPPKKIFSATPTNFLTICLISFTLSTDNNFIRRLKRWPDMNALCYG